MKNWILTISFYLITSCICCEASDEGQAFVAWAKANANPVTTSKPGSDIDDLMPLKDIVGDARLVCLGESRHDIHEQFRMKHRFFEFLVQEMGFTVLVLEESLAHARGLDAYVLGEEIPPDLNHRLNNLAGWFLWDTRELHDLIEWMRSYNADSSHKNKLRVYGVDVAAPRICVNNALSYLDRVDPEFAEEMRGRDLRLDLFEDQFWPLTLERYQNLSDEERDSLRGHYDLLVDHFKNNRKAYIEKLPEVAYEWANRQALCAHAGNGLFASRSLLDGGHIRDRAMADNLLWIMNTKEPDARVVFWAHNAHVSRTAFTMPERFDADMIDTVHHLDEAMGEDLVTLAASFNGGVFAEDGIHPPMNLGPAGEEFIDCHLARTGIPMFVLDLRKAPEEGPVTEWLDRPWRLQSQDVYMRLEPAKAYDAVYFIDEITRAQKSPLAKEKYQSMAR